MKKLLLFLLLLAANSSFGQFNCDSIHFASATEEVDLPSDEDLWMKFTYDAINNPLVVYPFYYIVLNDTSEVVVREELIMSYIGDSDSILFNVIYKNPLTPDGYTVSGTMDIHDPNATPNLICQFPFTLTVRNASVSLDKVQIETVSISPNPVNDFVTIRSESNIQEVAVVNALGQQIEQLEGNQLKEMIIDLSSIKSGWYHLNLVTESGVVTARILRR